MPLRDCRRSSNWSGGRSSSIRGRGGSRSVDFSRLGAVLGDMADLAAPVAGLAGRIGERAAVGRGAVARDVSQLAAGVALHGLGLAVPSKVVRPSALVAQSRATAGVAATESAVASTGHASAAAGTGDAAVGALPRQMADLAAAIAATARGATQAQRGAVSLDVAEALAVVALLRLRCARVRAAVGLVPGLLAVVAETLRRAADLYLAIVSRCCLLATVLVPSDVYVPA